MIRFFLSTICLFLFNIIFSQTVYDEKSIIKFPGKNYFPEVRIDRDNEELFLTIKDKSSKTILTQKMYFSQLPMEQYLSFYNSIGLLNDKNGNLFFCDFLTQKNVPYSGEYDRYNEGLGLGNFNPVLKNNTLRILDENLVQKVTTVLKVTPNSKQYWTLLAEGTDVFKGKIRLSKFIRVGGSNAENVYELYEFDVISNKLNRVK